MQVSIETTSGLERRLTVGVPAERVDQEVDNRLQQAKKNVRLPGFRPGKVPMRVMRQRFGAGVRQEVLGEVMSQSFQDAVMQENLRPAGQPTIEPRNLEAGRDLEYVATFEVFPEVTLKDVSGFAVEKPAASVTDEDVNNIIDVFRRQQGSWQEVERAAQEGDKVNIDFTFTLISRRVRPSCLTTGSTRKGRFTFSDIRYDMSWNSPSGGTKEIVRSMSNFPSFTHWWKETSSISMPEPGRRMFAFFAFASLSSSSLSFSPNLHSGVPER